MRDKFDKIFLILLFLSLSVYLLAFIFGAK